MEPEREGGAEEEDATRFAATLGGTGLGRFKDMLLKSAYSW